LPASLFLLLKLLNRSRNAHPSIEPRKLALFQKVIRPQAGVPTCVQVVQLDHLLRSAPFGTLW
jgi:hypothetical protein